MLLTHEECENILSNVLSAKSEEQAILLDYQVTKNCTAIGYLGDYYDLTLRYAAAETVQQKQLFIKALPQQSDEPEKEAIFRKEAWLYDSLLVDMQKCSPIKWSTDCYYSRADLMVLENALLSGFGRASGTQLDELHMLQLMRGLAAFHAASLSYEQRNQTNIGQQFGERLQEVTVASSITWFTTGLAAILTVMRTLPQYQLPQQLPEILSQVYGQVASSTKYCNVLCHRDGWAANMFFSPEPNGTALLIDFQTCCYSPPAIDLILSLYMNLSAAERRRLESKCIDVYYDSFAANLKHSNLQAEALVTKQELLQAYAEFRLFGAVYRAVATTVIKVPVEFVTNEFKYVERSAVILSYMQENEEFGNVMRECCEEVVEIALAMISN